MEAHQFKTDSLEYIYYMHRYVLSIIHKLLIFRLQYRHEESYVILGHTKEGVGDVFIFYVTRKHLVNI